MKGFLLKARIFLIILAFFASLRILYCLDSPLSAKLKVTETGHINISSGLVTNLTIVHQMPQESEFLTILSVSITPSIFSMGIKKDRLGNNYLEIYATSLTPGNYTYRITYLIETKERLFFKYPSIITFNETFSGHSNLTEPDSDITKYSYENFFGDSLTYKLYYLADFVKNFIKYDHNYSDIVLSAKEVIEKKKGTCDEFAIFYSSLLNSQNIPNRIVYGYAYSNNTFRPHAWNEIYLDNQWYPVDILFHEFFYLDNLHIPFYYSKGQPFFNRISIRGYNVSYQWTIDSIDIKILHRDTRDSEYSLSVTSPTILPRYGIISLNFNPNFCNEYSFELFPCVNEEGIPSLNVFPEKISLPLCNETKLYFLVWPGLFNKQYICPISLYINGKREWQYKIEIDSLFLDKLSCAIKRDNNHLTILYPKQDFYVLTDYGILGKDISELQLPRRPGAYRVWIYRGEMACDEIFPVRKRESIKISKFKFNESVTENQNFSVYFCIENRETPSTIYYILEYGPYVHSGEIFLDKNMQHCQKNRFTAYRNYNEIKLIVKSKGNFDVKIGYLNIEKKEKEKKKIYELIYEKIISIFRAMPYLFPWASITPNFALAVITGNFLYNF